MQRLLYIGNRLEKHGFSPTSADILPELFKSEGLNFLVFSSKKNKISRFLDITWQLIKYGPSSKYVLIDTYSTLNYWMSIWTGFLCWFLEIKYIPILRGGNLIYRLKNNPRISQFFFKQSFANIAPSRFLLDQFSGYGIPNLKYIPNNIPINKYQFKYRNRLRPKIFWLRAFAEIYNPQLAIQVLEKLLQKYPEAELCMVGPEKDGSLKELQHLVEKKGLPVSFPGKLDKKDWIALSREYDIFLNTTNVDNTPVSLMEAMALGLAVVSTKVGGIPYLIENNENGILVPAQNTEAMVRAIENLIADRELAGRLSSNGRKTVEKFDWIQVKELWLELLG